MVSSFERLDMDFDTCQHGRYHHQVMAMSSGMISRGTSSSRGFFSRTHGLSTNPNGLLDISPALQSRPGDPSNSEFKGLAELVHQLLIDTILTKKASYDYANWLRTFPFPPEWPRLQGPIHH